jgi:hypothetical protein
VLADICSIIHPAMTDGDHLSAAQRTLFDELYTAWRPGGTWPTYQHVDRLFDRHHDLDVDEIIAATPRHLLFVFDPIRPESKIGLRVAGIAKCSGSDQDLKLFLRLLVRASQRNAISSHARRTNRRRSA